MLRLAPPDKETAGNLRLVPYVANAIATSRWGHNVILLALVALGCARIVMTYHVFSATYDEPLHIAAGLEWLDRGTYTLETLHPPLARVAVALGPYLSGLHNSAHAGEVQKPTLQDLIDAGRSILYAKSQYLHNLVLARLGVLPFFALLVWISFEWARLYFGRAAAAASALLLTTCEPVLAHGGLATTDLPLAAMVTAALFTLDFWLRKPTRLRAILLGFTTGLAVLTKFTACLYLPLCFVVLLISHLWRGSNRESKVLREPASWLLIVLVSLFTIWAGYRFSMQTLTTSALRPHLSLDGILGKSGPVHDLAYQVAETLPVPAPGFATGIYQVQHLNSTGRKSYLLGHVRQNGWWYFFLVAVAVKTPIPFLIFGLLGLGVLCRSAWSGGDLKRLAPGLCAISILLVTMPTHVNIGLRHVLPIYPLLAIGGGEAAVWFCKQRRSLGVLAAASLLTWQSLGSVRAHPDYLAYFNELADTDPGRVLVISDLDWGQDLLRLRHELQVRRIQSVWLACVTTDDLAKDDLPHFQMLEPGRPVSGWVAISEMPFRLNREGFRWLDQYRPVVRIGRSISLYYIP